MVTARELSAEQSIAYIQFANIVRELSVEIPLELCQHAYVITPKGRTEAQSKLWIVDTETADFDLLVQRTGNSSSDDDHSLIDTDEAEGARTNMEEDVLEDQEEYREAEEETPKIEEDTRVFTTQSQHEAKPICQAVEEGLRDLLAQMGVEDVDRVFAIFQSDVSLTSHQLPLKPQLANGLNRDSWIILRRTHA
jgi:hypothetical protein